MINNMRIILHPNSSIAPTGRNNNVINMVVIKLIMAIQNPHTKFLKRPIVDVTRINVNAQKIGAMTKI